MKSKVSTTLVPAILLASCLLHGSAQQPRITLVERNAAPGAQSNAQPSVIHKQVPGEPDRVAYRFSQQVHVGSPVTEILEISFTQPTTLRSIEANNDFKVASATCQLARTYAAGESCQVSVTLDAKGPGNRAGLLTFTSNESATPDVVGLQGQTLGAVLSFIPAQISTVSQTMPSGKPLMYASYDIATDQGDNLYISDATSTAASGSGKIYFIDGSLALTTLVGGGATPVPASGNWVGNSSVDLNNPAGIAIDSFLDVYTAEYGRNSLDQTSRGNTHSIAGLGGTNAWGCSSPCTALSTHMVSPYWVNVDDAQNIFVTDSNGYYNLPWVSTGSFQLSLLNTVNENWGSPFGLDSTDNIYALETTVGQCMIDGITPASEFQWDAAGSGICGFAANNVRSQNAEIQNYIGGYAFDAAGDMYFSDSNNNVIRRVDSYNGLIRTVAGNASIAKGYTGDGGPATNAALDNPRGVAVDSMGNVFESQVDPAFTTGATQFVRKVGPAGELTFPYLIVGQTSAVETALLTNTGNDELMVSNEVWGGANPGDFMADLTTSSCVWSEGLAPGRSCQLGFTCKPTAAGLRSATITFVDNTAGFQNQLILNCYGLAAPVATTVTINPPVSGATYIAGSNVAFRTYVSNTLNPFSPPTGTVNMTVTNTGSNTTAATFSNLQLYPVNDVSESDIGVQYMNNASVGTYSVSATYSGDNINKPGSATAVPFSVVQVTPIVTITVPANNGQYLPGSMTATVTVSNVGLLPTAPSPTGTLSLVLTNTGTSAHTNIGPITMPAGSAGLTTTNNISLGSLAVGTYSLSASYSGDKPDKAANSTSITFSVVQVTPTVTITSPANGSQNLPASLTASVNVSNAGLLPTAPSPTGTLSLVLTNTGTNAQTPIGPITMPAGSNGVTTTSNIALGNLAVGNYSLAATYNGDTDDKSAAATPVTFSVVQVTPTVTITSPAASSSSPYLTALTYTAQVSNTGTTPAVPSAPSGTVTFTLTNTGTSAQISFGPYTLGSGSGGKVNISVPASQTPQAGNYTLQASYSGDTDDKGASSAASPFTVTKLTPTINWATPTAVYQGTALSSTQLDAVAKYNGNVVPGNYVYNPPSGTILETVGENNLGVTFTPTDTTDYNNALGSVQIDVLQQISGPAPTSTVLSAAANPALAGETVQFNARVSASSSATPTGWVTLWEGGKLLASAPISGGKASLKLTALTPGTHSLVATYSGDEYNGTSNSEPLKQVVSAAPIFVHDPVKVVH